MSGEEIMIQNDIASIRQGLQQRGFKAGQIRELTGKLNRTMILEAVRAISKGAASWDSGDVFLYYTGHGSFSGDSVQTARPALSLESPPALGGVAAGDVYWDEVFSTLHLSPGVRLTLLPDC